MILRPQVDDFGASYMGLSLRADFRPVFIKLGMTLIRDVDGDRSRRVIIAGNARIAAELDATIIAEGVETAAEAYALSDLGI